MGCLALAMFSSRVAIAGWDVATPVKDVFYYELLITEVSWYTKRAPTIVFKRLNVS